MTDAELLELNQQGFFPGPLETESNFLQRVASIRSFHPEDPIPVSHWGLVRLHLKQLFDFAPECLPAAYSNRSLLPWQGAATWIQQGKVLSVQLRKELQKGSFLGVYSREEILSHEAVHAARAPFEEDYLEEFFAYMTSASSFRRVLGPIVKRPWEVWPFLVCCLVGPFYPVAFLGVALWTGLGFLRLVRGHWMLRRAGSALANWLQDPKKIRAVLVRLTEAEIFQVAQGKEVGDGTLRWRLIRLAYWR